MWGTTNQSENPTEGAEGVVKGCRRGTEEHGVCRECKRWYRGSVEEVQRSIGGHGGSAEGFAKGYTRVWGYGVAQRDVEECRGVHGGGDIVGVDGDAEGYILSCYTHWLVVSQLKSSIIFCPQLPSVTPSNHRFSG